MIIVDILDHNTDAYYTILDIVMKNCDKAHVIIRPQIQNLQYVNEFLNTISDNLINKEEVSNWPGTSISGPTATIMYYNIDDRFIKKVKEVAKNFYEWVHPFLPEDLSFYCHDKEWLVNTAHEGYLTIISEDKEILEPILNHPGVLFEESDMF